jgi:riboflavin synthase
LFSGIVEEVGSVSAVTDTADGRRLKISAKAVLTDVKLGDSISVSGCCLTVTEFSKDWFTVEATHETLRRTKLGALKAGSRANLERALRVSDRLGGHIVSGHVDGLGSVTAIKQEGFSKVIEFAVDGQLNPFFVEKGSVTVDGVSLTVASLKSGSAKEQLKFSVALIPHTMSVTTLGDLKVADAVNIEADLIGKYVARLVLPAYGNIINKEGVSLPFLTEHGYT